jgi:hypothetical protein
LSFLLRGEMKRGTASVTDVVKPFDGYESAGLYSPSLSSDLMSFTVLLEVA